MTPDDVFKKTAMLWPLSVKNPTQAQAREELYREVLAGVAPDDLATAWRNLMSSYTTKSPPLPAEILACVPRKDAPQKTLAERAKAKPDKGQARTSTEIAFIMSEILGDERGRDLIRAGYAKFIEDDVATGKVNGMGDLPKASLYQWKQDKFTEALVKADELSRDPGTKDQAMFIGILRLGLAMEDAQRRADQHYIGRLHTLGFKVSAFHREPTIVLPLPELPKQKSPGEVARETSSAMGHRAERSVEPPEDLDLTEPAAPPEDFVFAPTEPAPAPLAYGELPADLA